jgi:hypothetical protein
MDDKGHQKPNPYYTNPASISMGAQLVQEQPFTNASSTFSFDFSINAPIATSTLNNVVLGKNNVLAFYAIQILIGEGANGNNRIYRSRGLTPEDDSLYNSVVTMKFEQSTLIDKMNGLNFRDVGTNANEFWAEAGLHLINPQRVVSGELGVFNLTINLINSISALVISPNLFISARLHGAFGQASGVQRR